jgi:hypothetical protein
LSVQAFVKTLCDLQTVGTNKQSVNFGSESVSSQVQFQKYLSRQFSIAFDLYLAIREHVHQRVQHILQRDTPDWRLKHACPACTYKLRDEAPLLYSMLYAIDGNDSLKRILRRSPSEDDDSSTPGPSSELPNSRKVSGDRYLSREYVDKWAKDVLQDMMGDTGDVDSVNFIMKVLCLLRTYLFLIQDYNPCANRWKNMKDEITKKMWGIFDETGIFLALCRHGFALVMADMVMSGELLVV